MGVKVKERDGAWWILVHHQGIRKAVLAPREAGGGAQDQDGGEGGEGAHARMSQQQAGAGMGVGRGGNAGVQAGDMSLEPNQEVEAVFPALGGVRRQYEGDELGAPARTPELGTQGEAAVEPALRGRLGPLHLRAAVGAGAVRVLLKLGCRGQSEQRNAPAWSCCTSGARRTSFAEMRNVR